MCQLFTQISCLRTNFLSDYLRKTFVTVRTCVGVLRMHVTKPVNILADIPLRVCNYHTLFLLDEPRIVAVHRKGNTLGSMTQLYRATRIIDVV